MRKLKLLCLCGLTAAVLMTGCAGSTDTTNVNLGSATVSEYRGVKINVAAPEVTDDEVDQKIQTNLKQNPNEVEVDRAAQDGDIVNIDVTVIKDEYHGDTSKMFIVGKPTILGERLCRVTQESLYLALRMVKPGIRLRTLGAAIQKYAEGEGFSVVREYCGHGIGRGFHEEPQVLHYDADDGGVVLQPGMTFTVEPMLNAGDYRIRTMKDGWTVKTKDRSLSAQYEHTIVVTENGCEILTLRKDDTIPAIITHGE